MTAWQLNWRGWSFIITMSHAYLPSSGPICLSNTTINPAQTQPRHSSGHHSNFLNPKGRITLMGLLQYCLTYRVWRSESRTIWTIVMWTIQPVRVFTVCYCFGRRDTKTHGGRGHLSTWAVPSWISVTVWLTATTFNGLKAFVLRALSQAWPVMVSLHGKGDGEGVKFCQHVSSHLWVLTLNICSCQCYKCPSATNGTKQVGTDYWCGQWFWCETTFSPIELLVPLLDKHAPFISCQLLPCQVMCE